MRGLPLFLLGCATPSVTPPVLDDLEVPVGQQIEVHPPVVGRGATVDFTITTTRRADLDLGITVGSGLTVTDFVVLDGYHASGRLTADVDAPLGGSDVSVTADGEAVVVADGLTVVAERIEAIPPEARMGETVTLTITGIGTDFEETAWVGLGDGVQTLSVDVDSPTQMTARVAIDSDARPGLRDVFVEQLGGRVVLYDGFVVDRAVVTASFSPTLVSQGDQVDFVLEGVNTRFQEDFSFENLQFWRRTAPVADLVIDELLVESDTRVTGSLTVSNAALPGFHDVYVNALSEILVQEAVEVLAVEPDPEDAVFSRSFGVRRTVEADGTVRDRVRASAWFAIPLNPPCVPAQVEFEVDGPVPFDFDGVFPLPDIEGLIVDCPEPLTVDAGDAITLEGESAILTLNRDIQSSTGQILYRADGLTLADYPFGETLDWRVPGAEGGVTGFFVEDAQPTVPFDYALTVPSGPIDRFEPFTLTWDEAGVYPTGLFTLSVDGALEEGGFGYAGVLPFDDGSHTFGANLMQQFAEGPATIRAQSRVEGRRWDANGRNYQGISSHRTTISTSIQ